MPQRKIDWDYYRHKYVSGDDAITLDYLSKLPNAPKLPTLKRRSTQDSWAEQRKTFRYQTSTRLAESISTQQAIEQTKQLVNVSEVITRHIQLCRAMQSIAAKRLRELKPEELSPKDLVSWISTATTIERLSLELATEKIEVQASVDIDLSKLDDRQLERLIKGEPLQNILN